MISPLVVENVTKAQFRQGDRKSVRALASISLEIKQGEFLAIMGASGSGKSTLLHLMAGLAQPDSGIVRVDGIDLASMKGQTAHAFSSPQDRIDLSGFQSDPDPLRRGKHRPCP